MITFSVTPFELDDVLFEEPLYISVSVAMSYSVAIFKDRRRLRSFELEQRRFLASSLC